MVSGSISLPCSGCFPPFPHGTGPLSVFRMYLALRDGPRRFRQDSSCPALLRWYPREPQLSCTGVSPSPQRLSMRFQFVAAHPRVLLQPRGARKRRGLGSAPFDRLYSGYRSFSFSSCGYLDVSVPHVSPSLSWCQAFSLAGCPIRTPAHQSLFATPHRFSQLTASFFASG